MYIKTFANQSTGAANALGTVTGNGTEIGGMTWSPDTPGEYSYNCSYHSTMTGKIVVEAYIDPQLTQAQKTEIEQAAAKWMDVIATDTTVSIDVGSVSNAESGPSGLLAQAGPILVSTATWLPMTGVVNFDPADLNGNGADLDGTIIGSTGKSKLYYTALHEIGHVLGIGTLWQVDFSPSGGENRNWLVDDQTGLPLTEDADNLDQQDPVYVGPVPSAAVYRYNKVTGLSLYGLPAENDGGSGTALGHAEEGDGDVRLIGDHHGSAVTAPGLGPELMTGFIDDEHMPLSVITCGLLEDLGWTVNYSKADSITLS